MNDVGISLQDYIKVWNANDNAFIQNPDGTITINVTTLPAAKFAMLLTSLFGSDYEFKVTSTYQLLAIPKNTQNNIINNDPQIKPGDNYKPDYEEPFKIPYSKDNTGAIEEDVKQEKDLLEIAERLDNDFVKIEVLDEELVIKSENPKALETLAKLADELNENLQIEIFEDKVIIK